MTSYYENKIVLVYFLMLCVFCMAGLAGAHLLAEQQIYQLWSDRDLMRAYQLGENFQYFGAELTGGGRVLGGLWYYILYFMQLINPSVLAIYHMINVLNIVSILMLFVFFNKKINFYVAIIFSSILISSYYQILTGSIWNPSLTPIINAIIYISVSLYFITHKVKFLYASFLFIAISAQLHLAILLIIPIIILMIFAFRVKTSLRNTILSLGFFTIPFIPFLYAYAFNSNFILIEPFKGKDFDFYFNRIDLSLGFYLEHLYLVITHFTSSFFSYDLGRFIELVKFLMTLNENIYSKYFLFHFFTGLAKVAIILLFLWSLIKYFFKFIYLIFNKKRDTNFLSDLDKICIFSAVSFLFYFVYFCVSLGYPALRYYSVTIISVFFLTSVAFFKICDASTNYFKKKYLKNSFLFSCGLVLFIFLVTNINSIEIVNKYFLEKKLTLSSLEEKRIIIEDISTLYNYSKEDWNGKVLVLDEHENGKGWFFYADVSNAINYLIIQDKNISDEPNYNKNCTLVLRKKDKRAISEEDIYESISAFVNIKNNFKILSTDDVGLNSYISYNTSQGQCLVSLNNRFVELEKEKEISLYKNLLSDEGSVLISKKIDSSKYIIRIERAFINYALLSIKYNKDLEIEFISNDFRGYGSEYHRLVDHFLGFEISKPRLLFKNINTSEEKEVYLYPGSISGVTKIFPPIKNTIKKFNKGQYKVTFYADDLILIKACEIKLDTYKCFGNYDSSLKRGRTFSTGEISILIDQSLEIR